MAVLRRLAERVVIEISDLAARRRDRGELAGVGVRVSRAVPVIIVQGHHVPRCVVRIVERAVVVIREPRQPARIVIRVAQAVAACGEPVFDFGQPPLCVVIMPGRAR
jgi:hypothetical protein